MQDLETSGFVALVVLFLFVFSAVAIADARIAPPTPRLPALLRFMTRYLHGDFTIPLGPRRDRPSAPVPWLHLWLPLIFVLGGEGLMILAVVDPARFYYDAGGRLVSLAQVVLSGAWALWVRHSFEAAAHG